MHVIGRHPHILKLHGVARDPQGKEHLVQELATSGSLQDALLALDDEERKLHPSVMLAVAHQVCEAMQAIAHAGLVHRDLAARNILLSSPLDPKEPRSVNAKVSDFGLSKRKVDLYSKTAPSESLPVRYMPPEAIERRRFSEKSDTWAFGVLLWEIATLCMVPYDSMGVFVSSDQDIKSGVCNGTLRLPCPPDCPQCVYQVMTACWEATPRSRPTFRELRFLIQEAAFELQAPVTPLQARVTPLSPPPAPPSPTPSPPPTSPTPVSDEWDTLAMLKEGKPRLGQVQAALQKHPGSVEVASNACRTVWNICYNNAANKMEAGRLGLLADIQATMQKHKGSTEAAWSACGAVCSICNNNDGNRAKAGQLGLLADIQAALRNHTESVEVAWRACGAVWDICNNSPANKEEAGQLGLLADVQAALRKHKKSDEVVRNACKAVRDICNNNAVNKVVAGRLCLLGDIKAVLRKHIGSVEVVSNACGAVKDVCNNNADNKVEAGRLNLLVDIQAALRKYKGSVEVARNACGAVWNICSDNAVNSTKAGRLGLLDIQAALRKHTGSDE